MALADDLISYWSLDEASGTRADSHGANDLTDNNTVGSATGKVGGAADFENGNSEYLSLAALGWYTAWTVSMWVNVESFAESYMGLFSRDDSGAPRHQATLYLKNNGSLAVYIDESGASADGVGSQTLSTGAWYHIVWSYSTSTGIQTWVNTVADIDTSDTHSPNTDAEPFRLGSDALSGFPRYFDGLIDEVGLWSRVLTSDERNELYNSGNGLSYDDITGGGASSISAAVSLAITGSVALTGDGALASSSTLAITVAAAFTGDGALVSSSTLSITGSVALTGDGALASANTLAVTVAAALTGDGALASAAALVISGSAALTGNGALASAATVAISVSSALTGNGALASAATVALSGSAALTGDGALASAATVAFTVTASLTGLTGSTAGTSPLSFSVSCTLTADGALSASVSLALSSTPAIGVVTVVAAVIEFTIRFPAVQTTLHTGVEFEHVQVRSQRFPHVQPYSIGFAG